MADLSKIVGAVIAIAVSVIVWKGHTCTPSDGLSHRDNPRAYHRGLHRNRWSTRGVFWPAWCDHRAEHRWSSHGGRQAHQYEVLIAAAQPGCIAS